MHQLMDKRKCHGLFWLEQLCAEMNPSMMLATKGKEIIRGIVAWLSVEVVDNNGALGVAIAPSHGAIRELTTQLVPLKREAAVAIEAQVISLSDDSLTSLPVLVGYHLVPSIRLLLTHPLNISAATIRVLRFNRWFGPAGTFSFSRCLLPSPCCTWPAKRSLLALIGMALSLTLATPKCSTLPEPVLARPSCLARTLMLIGTWAAALGVRSPLGWVPTIRTRFHSYSISRHAKS